MSAGDIRNGAYATRSKEYIWSTIADAFPGRITPSDFDAVVERNNCFFIFEGKTQGVDILKGQWLCLQRAIEQWPAGKAVLVVGEHPPADRVDVGAITSVRYWWRVRGSGLRGPRSASSIADVARLFIEDAEEHGHLEPEFWDERAAA